MDIEVSQDSNCGKLLGRLPNSELRPREHLTTSEVERLLLAAKKWPRYSHRNYCLILLMYRHGLRVSEAVNLRWSDVNFDDGDLYVRRLKQGKPSTHPLAAIELRALRQLQRDYPNSSFLFLSERGAPMSRHTAGGLIHRIGIAAEFPFPVHPHMLRHACGYKLANDGQDIRTIQDYLGHKNINHTVRYTELAPGRFRNFWRD